MALSSRWRQSRRGCGRCMANWPTAVCRSVGGRPAGKGRRIREQACMSSLFCPSLGALCVLADCRLQRGWHKEQCREAHLVSYGGSFPPVVHINNRALFCYQPCAIFKSG